MNLLVPARATHIGGGSQVGFLSAPPSGTIALLVRDRGGRILAITTGYLIERSRGREIVDAVGWPVGVPNPLCASCRRQPVEALLGTITLAEETYVRHQLPAGREPSPPRDETDLLGQRVWKLAGNERRPGRIRCIRSVFAIEEKGEDRRLLEGAFEIAPDDPSSFDTPADGGALIVDDSNAPVGVLVASSGSRHFAAPISAWLARNRLELLDRHTAARHNAAIRKEVFDQVWGMPMLPDPGALVRDRRERLLAVVKLEPSPPSLDAESRERALRIEEIASQPALAEAAG